MHGIDGALAPEPNGGALIAPGLLESLVLFVSDSEEWEAIAPIVARAAPLAPAITIVRVALHLADFECDETPPSWTDTLEDDLEVGASEVTVREWRGQSFNGVVREAARLLAPDLALLAWPPRGAGTASRRESLADLMERPPCRLLLVAPGQRAADWERVVVLADGRAEPFALELARALSSAGEIERFEAAHGRHRHPRHAAAPDVTRSPEVTWRAIEAAAQTSGATVATVPLRGFGRFSFPSVRARTLDRIDAPVLLLTRPPSALMNGARRILVPIAEALPTLTEEEKVTVYRDVRRAARAGQDFHALIVMAAVIAIAGLLADNAAVVIGGMLVAPLMSPIVALGLGVVQGDVRVLRLAGGALWSGSLLTLFVSAVAAIAVPGAAITDEIASRAQPALLDLLVAVAAGCAATYAVCRKPAAAALPGVAVAAALVPPLASAGLSAALGEGRSAAAAAVLFGTNVSAIAGASAATFIWLGFQPERERVERLRVVGRGFAGLAVVVLVFATSLIWLSYEARREVNHEREMQAALSGAATTLPEGTAVGEALQSRVDGRLRLTVELRGPVAPSSEQLQAYLEAVTERFGEPVDLLVEVVPVVHVSPSD